MKDKTNFADKAKNFVADADKVVVAYNTATSAINLDSKSNNPAKSESFFEKMLDKAKLILNVTINVAKSIGGIALTTVFAPIAGIVIDAIDLVKNIYKGDARATATSACRVVGDAAARNPLGGEASANLCTKVFDIFIKPEKQTLEQKLAALNLNKEQKENLTAKIINSAPSANYQVDDVAIIGNELNVAYKNTQNENALVTKTFDLNQAMHTPAAQPQMQNEQLNQAQNQNKAPSQAR